MKIIDKIIEYSIYLFVFLLPWQTRWIWQEGWLNGYWEYGTLSLYLTEILLIIILILFGIRYFRKKKAGKIQGNWPVWIFLLFAGLSIFWAIDRQLTNYAWIKFCQGVFLFWLINTLKINLKKIGYSLVFAGGVQAILAISQFFSQSISPFKWFGLAEKIPFLAGVSVAENTAGRWLRAYGSLPHPNILGGFLVVAILLLIGLILSNPQFHQPKPRLKTRLLLIIHYSLFIILLIGLGLTFSRGAWLALLIGIIVFLAMLWRKKILIGRLGKEVIVIGLLTIAIFSIIFWPMISTRFQAAERLELKSQEEHLTGFSQALFLIKKSPFWGVGLGNYTRAVWQKIDSSQPSWYYQPVHNLYLLILAELGIIGLFLLGWVVCKVLSGIRYPMSYLSITCWSSVVSLLIIGLFDHWLWSLYFGIVFFWLILGLAFRKID